MRRKQLDALHEDALLARKAAEQAALRESVAKDAELKKSIGDPWSDIDAALADGAWTVLAVQLHRGRRGLPGPPRNYARTLVRGAAERAKPNSERFREYTDAALPRIEQQLGAAVPVYPELEELRLATASSACASGWARIIRWCASCCRRSRRPRSRSAW